MPCDHSPAVALLHELCSCRELDDEWEVAGAEICLFDFRGLVLYDMAVRVNKAPQEPQNIGQYGLRADLAFTVGLSEALR